MRPARILLLALGSPAAAQAAPAAAAALARAFPGAEIDLIEDERGLRAGVPPPPPRWGHGPQTPRTVSRAQNRARERVDGRSGGSVTLQRGARRVEPSAGTSLSWIRTCYAIRRRSYDFALDAGAGARGAWLALLGGARFRVGFRRPFTRRLYTLAVPAPRDRGADGGPRWAALLAPLGVLTHPGPAKR